MKMGYLHGVAALAIAGYLYQVNAGGNAPALYEMAREDLIPFSKWGLAAAILLWVISNTGAIGASMGVLIVAAAALNVGPTVIEGVEQILE